MESTATLEEEIKQVIVDALMLEDVSPEDIDRETPLFNEGLGLDSIDALELGMALSKKYHIKISQDVDENRRHFENVKCLSAFVRQKMQAAGKESE